MCLVVGSVLNLFETLPVLTDVIHIYSRKFMQYTCPDRMKEHLATLTLCSSQVQFLAHWLDISLSPFIDIVLARVTHKQLESGIF